MTKPLFLARLAGTQQQMGAQHGRLVADDARELVAFYRTMPERALVGEMAGRTGLAARLGVRALATAWQANLTRTRPRDLLERSRAFVAATGTSGVAAGLALVTMATMDSLQNCVSLVARRKLGPFGSMPRSPGDDVYRPDLAMIATRAASTAAHACTSVIAWGDATSDGELLFARNFDFPGVGVWDAAPAFVVNAPTAGQRYAFFARRGADTAVVTCVNEAGLVIAPHTRWHADAAWSGAMIIDLVHDIARRAETVADAIAIARERPVSSTWGVAIGSARERTGIVLEIAGPSLEVVRSDAGAGFLVCANRYRTAGLQEHQVAASSAWALHSERRERRLRALVEGRRAALTAETLARFMGDRHDVDAPARTRRIGAVLAQPTNVHCAVVAPASRRALVGVDQAPVCDGTWAELSWTWEGPTGGWEVGAGDPPGFSVRLRDDVGAPQDDATRLVHDAVRAYESHHDVPAARAAIERAITHAPDDPSLYQAAAWLAHEAGDAASAVAHVASGLALEDEPYRRGQLLLWGLRAARDIDPGRSARWSDELGRLEGPHVAELQAAARRPASRPHVNLVMADAY